MQRTFTGKVTMKEMQNVSPRPWDWNRKTGKPYFLIYFSIPTAIAVLTVSKKTALNRETAEKMLRNVLSAFIKQEKPDWEFPDERGAV